MLREPGDTIRDFWGDTYEIVRIEPNFVRNKPDYICRGANGNLVSVPAQNIRDEDMAAHRRKHEQALQIQRTQLRAIRRGLVADWNEPWPGAEFGKGILGQAIDGAIECVERDLDHVEVMERSK